MINDICASRKTLIRGALVALIALPFFCFLTDLELYPFAPYNMYSHPFSLPINKFRFEVADGSGNFQPLTDIEGFGQDFLISFLRRIDAGENGTTEDLKERLSRCMKLSCRMNVGEKIVVMPSIKKLRGVRDSFNQLSDLVAKVPSRTDVLIELHYD